MGTLLGTHRLVHELAGDLQRLRGQGGGEHAHLRTQEQARVWAGWDGMEESQGKTLTEGEARCGPRGLSGVVGRAPTCDRSARRASLAPG